MLDEYQSASLTVLPSLNEGMSIATLEALACGQYVVATKVSHNDSLITSGINGEFIEKKNPIDIAEKILSYYNNKFLNNYLIPIEDLHKYHVLYEWDKIVEDYEQDLDKITYRKSLLKKS